MESDDCYQIGNEGEFSKGNVSRRSPRTVKKIRGSSAAVSTLRFCSKWRVSAAVATSTSIS